MKAHKKLGFYNGIRLYSYFIYCFVSLFNWCVPSVFGVVEHDHGKGENDYDNNQYYQ